MRANDPDPTPTEAAPSKDVAAGAALDAPVDAERRLARLAAGLAHEIKNPLSTMAINLALLEEEWARAGSEPSAREKRAIKRLATLQREIKRLETIVEDFLRYARGGEVNRSPRDLGTLVRETLEFVETEDARQGIRHHVEIPMGLPLVMLDEGAFRQALLNLFVNARQAMPMGGEMIVRVQRAQNQVELSVTDTGVGMTPEALERCFDPYFSTKKGGTGLGLATTRRIVEEHDGRIHVVSEPNRGTSFSIVLPLLVEIHGVEERGAEERGVEKRGAEKRGVEERSVDERGVARGRRDAGAEDDVP
jgi:signal transduction histidine kinase